MSLIDDLPSEDPPSYTPSQPSTATSTHPAPSPPARRLPPPPPLSLPSLNLLRSKRLILASASPRRRHLLSLLGLTNVEIIPSNFAENLSKTTASPYEYVLATATEKALTVYKAEAEKDDGNTKGKEEVGLIIAADTIVVSSRGEILEKPRSEVEHISMLRNLRDGGYHKVYTSLCLIAPLASARDPGYVLETATEETSVLFDREVTDELLLAYVKTREGADKAGGYALQGSGSVLVERIEGSWDNVVGLPLRRLVKLIEEVVEKSEDEDLLDGEEDELGE